MTSLFKRLLDLIYVPKCLGCGTILPEADSVLCRHCETRYKLLCHRKCRECGRDLCSCDCTKEGIARMGVWRLGKLCAYLPKEKRNPLTKMLFALKQNNDAPARKFFSRELTHLIRDRCNEADFTLCYVPRSIKSYKKYGYDHMKELCRVLSEELGIKCEELFYREKNARIQKDLGRSARFANAEQSIFLKDGNDVQGRRFILVDDVCVTGASLGRCASLLINEGAREVRCFVIATRP